MDRLIRTRTDPAEMRARILAVADEQFRRIGFHKTSVADIAAELGMSAANVYRFFPSKGAIIEAICGRVIDEVAESAFVIARTSAPASEKLTRLLAAVHHHNKTTLIKEKRVHDMIVAAIRENRAIIKAHIEQMVGIFEAIIREGIEAGEFMVEEPGEAARAVNTAFMPFFHPILLEHCPRYGEDLGAGLREQTRFILKALGKSD